MRAPLLVALLVAAVLALPVTGSGSVPTQVGPGEGKLALLAWEGYVEKQWVIPFERSTGCEVDVRYASSPEEMFRLFVARSSRFDLVSASGETALRLVDRKAVQPVDVELVPGWRGFAESLRSPSFNTVGGVHYGVTALWGANLLLFDAGKVRPAPTTWSAVYDRRYAGRIAVPDNPLQIADAALYLARARPALRIRDPYVLTRQQFDAAIELLTRQRSLARSYWDEAGDEVGLFAQGKVWLGSGWQYQAERLAEHDRIRAVVPREGVTGWADTWMLSSRAEHPNCAYRWLQWVSTPTVQAQQAVFFGATPASRLACTSMDRIEPGSCARYRADAPDAYARAIRFWKTPGTRCGEVARCVPYTAWLQAWDRLMR